jgi:dihydrofolate reductase
MRISMIAAMANNHVIGINNNLPWKLPADMQWFRKHTLGKPVIMGRLTWESLRGPLPQRLNIVVSRDTTYRAEGAEVLHDVDAAIKRAAEEADEVMVIGGAGFYKEMLPRAQRLYLTYIHADFEGDAWFPEIDLAQWREIEREDHQRDEKNSYDYSFVILERVCHGGSR